MPEFLKRQRASFYLCVVAAILTLAGLIVFAVSNGVENYDMAGAPGVIVAQVVALILLGLSVFGMLKYGDTPLVSVCMFVALVLISLSFAFALVNRVDIAASLFTYDWSNKDGWQAFGTGMASMVIFLVAALCVTVSGFMKLGPRDNI